MPIEIHRTIDDLSIKSMYIHKERYAEHGFDAFRIIMPITYLDDSGEPYKSSEVTFFHASSNPYVGGTGESRNPNHFLLEEDDVKWLIDFAERMRQKLRKELGLVE